MVVDQQHHAEKCFSNDIMSISASEDRDSLGQNECNGMANKNGSIATSEASDTPWFSRSELPWWARVAIPIVKLGPIPRHIAFVMDGNRRFARNKLNSQSVLEGHAAGFTQLMRVLDWCDRLGVREVTVYAFSIENFKRPAEEVQGLMAMAEHKLAQLLERKDELAERQLRVRFFGNRSMLSERIVSLMERIERVTEANKKTFLNTCIAYTSRDEIARAFESIRIEVQQGSIQKSDIDEALISSRLDTRDCLPLDMLIRTSECRLSDFLIWQIQSSNTHLHFDADVLWPDFSVWHLLKAIVQFQLACTNDPRKWNELTAQKQQHDEKKAD